MGHGGNVGTTGPRSPCRLSTRGTQESRGRPTSRGSGCPSRPSRRPPNSPSSDQCLPDADHTDHPTPYRPFLPLHLVSRSLSLSVVLSLSLFVTRSLSASLFRFPSLSLGLFLFLSPSLSVSLFFVTLFHTSVSLSVLYFVLCLSPSTPVFPLPLPSPRSVSCLSFPFRLSSHSLSLYLFVTCRSTYSLPPLYPCPTPVGPPPACPGLSLSSPTGFSVRVCTDTHPRPTHAPWESLGTLGSICYTTSGVRPLG